MALRQVHDDASAAAIGAMHVRVADRVPRRPDALGSESGILGVPAASELLC